MPRIRRDNLNGRISNFEKKHGIPPDAMRGKGTTTKEFTQEQLKNPVIKQEYDLLTPKYKRIAKNIEENVK